MLHGREEELAAIELLLQRARAGRSGTLVLRGEAGIGKSALLDRAAEAADLRVLRGTGVESERGMPYAGLHLLLGRHLDRVGALPDAQAEALRRALGRGGGANAAGSADPARPAPPAPPGATGGDRFLVGLAVLTLLSDLAEERPLLCLLDDAQWLDGASAEALLFAARRLEAEPIVMLFAARDPDAPEFPAPGVPELRLTGLDDAAAAGLLDERAAGLPAHVRREVLAEARGNPLALLELPVGASRTGPGPASVPAPDPTAGPARGARPVTATYGRLWRTFAERVEELPEATRTVLLVAASDDQGELGTVLAAAGRLGAGVADLEPAERARLVRSAEGRLEFRHPLIRSAVYQGSPVGHRLRAHAALAEAYAASGDLCHRAWHLANAATGHDELAAAALEEAAEGERQGGGQHAAASMYEWAAGLSPDPADRGRRLAAAARAAADAGEAGQAFALAGRAAPDVADDGERAGLVLLRAALADEQDRTREASRLLVEEAVTIAAAEPHTAGHLLFQAASSAGNAGDLAELERIAGRAEEMGAPNAPYVRALARVFAGQNPLGAAGAADGVAALRELLDGMRDCLSPRDVVRFAMWHLMLGDVRGGHEIAASLERRFRDEGAIGLLSLTLMPLSRTLLMLGRTRDALTAADEGMRIAADTGQHRIRVYQATVLALIAAMRGDEERCAELAAEAIARDVPPSSVHAVAALGLLDLGAGRHEAALNRLTELVAGPPNRQGAIASLPDLVEAAVRSGRPERGADAAAWYREWSAQVRLPWAEAVALRCAALLATDDDAEKYFAQAVELHRQGGIPFERARTELLYGEWLRRARRKNDARAQLHSALDAFERLGATPWAERARTELRAAGESFADSAAEAGADLLALLTPQELQVVRLAATGLSNREIGAQLFLSPRTVGYHLYKAYPKLGVASRGELSRLPLT